jgi:hypothetical protein
MYHAFQLAGPYTVTWDVQPIMYPPPAFLLFAPFAYAPVLLWWVLPIAVTVAALAWQRPRPIAIPAMAACFVFPSTQHMLVTGNPGLWAVAAVAAGTILGWPAVAVFLKPTLAPFALVGIRRRSWWLVAALGLIVCVVMLPQWLDYIRALMNAQSNGMAYSIDQVPAMLLPITAWLASSRSSGPLQRLGRPRHAPAEL